jgi:hypothetical protein
LLPRLLQLTDDAAASVAAAVVAAAVVVAVAAVVAGLLLLLYGWQFFGFGVRSQSRCRTAFLLGVAKRARRYSGEEG